ncbi:MAG: thioredoxin-like domain-containing protein [Gammaproteobacteria bacterium]|nr:thioredoxin-like domain-containing protein [Gammaproteobacteria bacterium]
MIKVINRLLAVIGAFVVVAMLAAWGFSQWQKSSLVKADEAPSYAGTNAAPEFPSGMDWLNTGGRELSVEQLNGKIILLDFWTYGCINCLHVIPDLKRLEEKYAEELVVIGVHSAKFERESTTSGIRRFVQRYQLVHPVVNDKDHEIWRSYGVRAWPTLVVIDPAGNIVGQVSGEGNYDLLDSVIGGLTDEFEIDRTALSLQVEERPTGQLSFPGKVLADSKNDRLFIADTGNHRIVVAGLDGQVQHVIGGELAGFADGTFAEARFRLPQGMTLLDKDTLLLADTENHSIRRIDLAAETVSTLAGNGRQAFMFEDIADPDDALNSPWDLLLVGDTVYVAMAGQHQVWSLDPASGRLTAFAGSRREELKDGKLLSAGLNQPSGLTTDGESLFIADSEASAIRSADLGENGRLHTLVGTGLFDFGDIDGRGRKVRLQHPLGVAWQEGAIYIADTYNNKIKRLDPDKQKVVSLTPGGQTLDEPGGLSIAGQDVYIADTNNHRIRILDLKSGELSDFTLNDPRDLL